MRWYPGEQSPPNAEVDNSTKGEVQWWELVLEASDAVYTTNYKADMY